MRLLLELALFFLQLVKISKANIPGCHFLDTVDISNGQKLSNGSYLFEGLLIPAHLTGEYQTRPDSKEEVTRGCICHLKPCVRICCPEHTIEYSKCYQMTKKELDGIDPYLNITLDNGLVVKKYLKTDLIVQWDLPVTCDEMYYESNRQKDVSKNISLHHDKVVTIMQEYYHQNVYIKEDHNSTYIMPYSCLPPKSSKITQTVVMIISLVCMVLTISVYLYLKDLRNLLGKCFICYLVSLFMAYLFLVLDLWDLSNDFCVSAGYMGYFFAMSTFFWLSVISLHLWNAISGNSFLTNCFLTTNEFLTYNTYAWGMPITLTFVTFIANEFVKNEEWNPRVGYKMDCWVYTYDWSAVIYFYGPMLFLIAFNMIMFILTAFQITMVKRIIKNFAIKQDREHKICMDKQNNTFFLRLVIIMGLTWSFEIMFFLTQAMEFWSDVFMVASYLNWSQGINILVLFILKPNILKQLKQQLVSEFSTNSNSQNLTKVEVKDRILLRTSQRP